MPDEVLLPICRISDGTELGGDKHERLEIKNLSYQYEGTKKQVLRNDIVSFYMSGCAQYLLFAVVLAALGVLIQKKGGPAVSAAAPAPRTIVRHESMDDEAFEEWLRRSED